MSPTLNHSSLCCHVLVQIKFGAMQCFEVFAWIRETRMGTTKDLEDRTAEIFSMMVDGTYGKENEEFFPMVVMDYLKAELYYKVDMEVLYGKNWT